MADFVREAKSLEETAVEAERNHTNSPFFHALLRHKEVTTSCGALRAVCRQPPALSSLEGRLQTKSPVDGLFDATELGTPSARDDLHVELRRPDGTNHTMELWVFIAHLASLEDVLPPGRDSEDEEEKDAEAKAQNLGTGLQGVFDGGNWSGFLLWDAAIHATAFLLSAPSWAAAIACSACVLELGAGLGLPGLVCGRALGARRVALTDRVPQMLELLEENVLRNFCAAGGHCHFSVETLDWSAAAAHGLPGRLGVESIDVVLCCDCILPKLFGVATLLADFLAALAKDNPSLRVLISKEIRPGCGVWAFLERASADFDIRRVGVHGLVHLYELVPLSQYNSLVQCAAEELIIK